MNLDSWFNIQVKNTTPALYLSGLAPGYYTFILKGSPGSEGEAVVNIYRKVSGRLSNIAGRGYLTATQPMYGAFNVKDAATNVILVGNGPALIQHGISTYLADPVMEVYNANGNLMQSNDNWADDATSADKLRAASLAPAYATEPALYLTLDPGYYTFILKGVQGSEGEAVVNIYQR